MGLHKNPSVFTCILLLCIIPPIGVVLTTLRYKVYRRWWSVPAITITTSLPLLILSGSRASWVALAVVVLYLYTRTFRFRIKYNTKSLVLYLLIVGACAGCGYGIYLLKKDSADGRILIWKVALEMLKDKPITGFGPNGFSTNYMDYQARYLKEKGNDREKRIAGSNHLAYNEPIRIWVEYGAIGLMVYLFFIVALLRIPGRIMQIHCMKGVIVGYIVWGLFNFPARIFPIQIIIITTLALLSHKTKPLKTVRKKTATPIQLVFIILIGVTTAKLYQISESYQAYNNLLATYRKMNSQDLTDRLAFLEKDMKHEPGYWSFYCSTLFHYQKDSLLKEKIRCWNNVFPTVGTYLMWGDVHFRNGNLDEAESNYTKAHYMTPVRQSARGKLVWLYRKRGEEEQALLLTSEILSEKVKIYSFETYTLHQKLKEAFGEDIINLINSKNKKE